jgi:predicted nucleic acid-binding protein
VSAAQFLIDTSTLARLMRPGAVSLGWDQAAAAGLIAVCPITELEFFCSARSATGRVQGELTSKSQHRSAGPVDLVLAATAELFGLTLLHCDHDFEAIARVTGQPFRRYGPDWLTNSVDAALVPDWFRGLADDAIGAEGQVAVEGASEPAVVGDRQHGAFVRFQAFLEGFG